MKLFNLTAIMLIAGYFHVSGQVMYKPSEAEISSLPLWAKKMYEANPNVFEVDSLYRLHFNSNPFVKTYHTQYYKRWRRKVESSINEQGYVIELSSEEKQTIENQYLANQQAQKASSWICVGPYHTQKEAGAMGGDQANIYSFDQCKSQLNVLYCGTEPGEVYKSTDGGNSWVCISHQINFGSGVTAIEVNPFDPNIVFAGGSAGLMKSSDGGNTWTTSLGISNLDINEILIHPGNDQIIFAACDDGLFRSTDGGANWTNLFTNKTFDIKVNVANSNIMYLLRDNPTLKICEFYSSTDMGLTWNLQSNGWYSSTDPARNDGGARLAVTEADPNRIYAYLIGEAKANDYGFIGVYRSDDGGNTWTLPNGPAGGPYSSSHINMAIGYVGWDYHQGFYNCALLASETDPDEIIVGGLSLYKSTDGGVTFNSIAGYAGGPLDMHVDNQDFRSINGQYWATTDGGIYHSTDFFASQPQYKMDGINSCDFWGFGTGWNEDVMVGGLYHNGNVTHHENYGAGNFLSVGGGEAPTGYVDPGNNRRTYFSDIGGKVLPLSYTGPVGNFSVGKYPNESYWAAESSEMEFHPNCYSIAYLGNENKFWKTSDGGGSYTLVKTFGTNVQDIITHIEISSSNPDVMYVAQRPNSGSLGYLWKTTDGGANWQQLTIPAGNSRRIILTINPVNYNELWMAYPSGSNGDKVFKTTDGGQTWTNLTSSAINNESVQSIAYVAGTDGGIYAATGRAVYYRTNANTWTLENQGLPTFTSGNIIRPFYRDGKIRLASYGKGIWESSLTEQPALPICRITVDKLDQSVYCEIDSFYFEDHSFLNHTNASWSWEFPTGSPATSSLRNPSVYFANAGSHLAVLTITDQNGNSDVDSIYVEVNSIVAPTFVDEDFESSFLPDGWFLSNEPGGGNWLQSTSAGGFGTSTQSAIFNNYDYDAQGYSSDMNIPLNSLGMSEIQLSFDVAYAPYGGQYSDSLEVLVSTDCGLTYNSLFFKGGSTLATSPNLTDYFTPSANEWRTETLNLSAFVNFNKVIIAFRNHGHWGNNIYVDNINIQSDLGNVEIGNDKIEVYPNPIGSGCLLNIEGVSSGFKVKVLDMNGKCVYRNNDVNSNQIQLPDGLSSGMYRLNIQTETNIWNKPLVIK